MQPSSSARAGFAASLLTLLLSFTAVAQAAEPCGRELPGWRSMAVQSIALAADHGRCFAVEVRVADDQMERAAGYQHVCPEVVDKSAIFFVFQNPLRAPFHMRNVYAPLDIAFFDASGTMVDMATMRPEPPGFGGERRYYGSRLSYLYALETRRGFLAEQSLVPGRARLLVKSLP